MNLRRKKTCHLYWQWIQRVSYPMINLTINLFLLDLSSTTAWMESMIKKKQKKKGKTSSQAAPQDTDVFEELNRYLNKTRLTREECPNPVAYWGVSVVSYIT